MLIHLRINVSFLNEKLPLTAESPLRRVQSTASVEDDIICERPRVGKSGRKYYSSGPVC